jgi:hypothetical protein
MEADATQVMKLAELIQDVHNGMTLTQVTSIFYHDFDDNNIDIPEPFYPVWIASYPESIPTAMSLIPYLTHC